jgi:DNA-binding HxlR family transcriptional regulator
MPATVRYDEQYCPIARALDVLGDRWTLLILRELMRGDQRFTDLKVNLPGVTPAVLSARLHTLAEQGLIAFADAAGPRPRYAITEHGRAAAPVMRALARFGMPLLADPDGVPDPRPWSAVQTCLIPYWDAVAAAGVDEEYLFLVDGEEHPVATARGGSRPSASAPAVVVDTSAATLFAVRKGLVTYDDAVAQGRLVVRGSKAAIARMRRVYRLGPRA